VFWFYAALSLLGIVSVTVSHSGRVRIAGCILLAGLLGWGLLQRLMEPPNQVRERRKSVSPLTEVAPLALESVNATQLVLTGGGGPYELRGRITNSASGTRLSSVTFSIKRRDCYSGALDPSGCDLLFEDQHWIPLSVPGGESREFVSAIWAHSPVPRARGTIKDEISVAAATGAAAH
jgi:hypothetical protein